jgi:hypothetical protein
MMLTGEGRCCRGQIGLPDRGVAHHGIDRLGHVPVGVLGAALDPGDARVGDGAGGHGEHRR